MAVRCRNATRRRSSKVGSPAYNMHQGRTAFCHPFLSSEIHRRMKFQYGDACLSLQQVYGWTKKFMNGIGSVILSPRPGQAHRVVTSEATAAAETIVKENRRVTVNEIAAHQDMSHGSAHFVHDVLQFHKAFSKLRDKKIFKIFT